MLEPIHTAKVVALQADNRCYLVQIAELREMLDDLSHVQTLGPSAANLYQEEHATYPRGRKWPPALKYDKPRGSSGKSKQNADSVEHILSSFADPLRKAEAQYLTNASDLEQARIMVLGLEATGVERESR